MWSFVTLNDLCSHLFKMKYLLIRNISIHTIFYQIRFINECVREEFSYIPVKRDKNTEFFVRCRRTYVLNMNIEEKSLHNEEIW